MVALEADGLEDAGEDVGVGHFMGMFLIEILLWIYVRACRRGGWSYMY